MIFLPSGVPFGYSPSWEDLDLSQDGVDALAAIPFVVGLWQIYLPLMAGGALVCLCSWACERAGRALQKQYQLRMRRGYYWYEKRREEAKRKFVEDCRDYNCAPDAPPRRYDEILDAFNREMDEIEEESWRDHTERRRRSASLPWASPKAAAGRARRRARRLGAWRAWAKRFAAAVHLGRTPPDPPSGRRGGNGGAPIRRLCERSLNPPPAPEALVAQWEKAHGRAPAEEKVRLGSMMLDIEAAVDSSLLRNAGGEIVGRRAGVLGWLRENCPEMLRHYRALMDCRQLADRFRKVHGVRDPLPAAILLEKELPKSVPAAWRKALEPRHAAARRLLAISATRTEKGLFKELERCPILGAAPRRVAGGRRRTG